MSNEEIRFAPFSPAQQEALGKPFGAEMVRYKPGRGGGARLPYVSHGGITKRLNDVAPGWEATMVERYVAEVNGQLHCLGGVMRLTIGGVTREEAGGPARLTTLADDLKNTYSDCLKRCAMRFGVALDLWESAEEHDEDAEGAPQTPPDAPGATEPGAAYSWADLKPYLASIGIKSRADLDVYLGASTDGWAPADILTAVKDKQRQGGTR